jgi:hypothetical protein
VLGVREGSVAFRKLPLCRAIPASDVLDYLVGEHFVNHLALFKKLCPDNSWLVPSMSSQQVFSRNPLATRVLTIAPLDVRSKSQVVEEVTAKEAEVVEARAERAASKEEEKLLLEQPGAYQLCFGSPVGGVVDTWFSVDECLKDKCGGVYAIKQMRFKLHGNSKTYPDSAGLVQPFVRVASKHSAIRIRATPGFESANSVAEAGMAEAHDEAEAHGEGTEHEDNHDTAEDNEDTGNDGATEALNEHEHGDEGGSDSFESEGEVCNVQRILKGRGLNAATGGDAREYLVLWEGSSEHTWEPASSLSGVEDAIEDWKSFTKAKLREKALGQEEKRRLALNRKAQCQILSERGAATGRVEFLVESSDKDKTTAVFDWLTQSQLKSSVLADWDSLSKYERACRSQVQARNVGHLQSVMDAKMGAQLGTNSGAGPRTMTRTMSEVTNSTRKPQAPTRQSKRGKPDKASYHVGQHVLAFWSQQMHRDLSRGPQYPGAIQLVNADGTYDVAFFDNLGSVDHSVPAEDIVPKPAGGGQFHMNHTPEHKRPKSKRL